MTRLQYVLMCYQRVKHMDIRIWGPMIEDMRTGRPTGNPRRRSMMMRQLGVQLDELPEFMYHFGGGD